MKKNKLSQAMTELLQLVENDPRNQLKLAERFSTTPAFLEQIAKGAAPSAQMAKEIFQVVKSDGFKPEIIALFEEAEKEWRGNPRW